MRLFRRDRRKLPRAASHATTSKFPLPRRRKCAFFGGTAELPARGISRNNKQVPSPRGEGVGHVPTGEGSLPRISTSVNCFKLPLPHRISLEI